VNRRDLISVMAAGAIAGRTNGSDKADEAGLLLSALSAPSDGRSPGRLKQSVSYWPYGGIPLATFAARCKEIGLVAIDLLQPEEWKVVQDAGLACSMGYPSARRDFLSTGFNDTANHALLLGELEKSIPLAKRAGVTNVITMFGNRRGKSDVEGRDNSIAGLKKIAPLAQEHGVTLHVELLNSKVDHRDYQGDHTAWGVEVMKGVGSPNVKLLYDIYHMQIMEGDVIRTIRDNIQYLGHFHTGGVPGRHELDGTQELNWNAIAKAIADTGFQGYVAHEFMPTRDPLTSLKEAYQVCLV
jgi:hydroxypyruvate isomerase